METFIFFWLGARSSLVDRAAASLIAKIMDATLAAHAVEVRILEGHEPLLFRSIFLMTSITVVDCEEEVKPLTLPSSSSSDEAVNVFLIQSPSKDRIAFKEVKYCRPLSFSSLIVVSSLY